MSTIWVDADAAPRAVKEILYRAAERARIDLILVANQWLTVPRSPYIRFQIVGAGFDVADDYIVDHVEAGDLVITADIPLAAAAVEKGALIVDPRGDVIDEANAKARLAMRDFMESMRESGVLGGGPKPYSDRDKRNFAGVIDRWLAKGVVR